MEISAEEAKTEIWDGSLSSFVSVSVSIYDVCLHLQMRFLHLLLYSWLMGISHKLRIGVLKPE